MAAASADRPDPPTLAVTGLRKSFEGVVALDGLELTLAAGEVHALLGENGSGKSTFIKILSGYYQPDDGEVQISGTQLQFGSSTSSYSLGCRFVHQDLGLIDSMSIADNLAVGSGYPTRIATVRDRAARALARQDLHKVGLQDLDPRARVESLNPARKTGIAVARALRENPATPARLLVLDEPTATLPLDEVEHLLQIVHTAARNGVTVLYVSHRLDEIFRIADNVTVLRDGRKVLSRPIADIGRATLISSIVGGQTEEPVLPVPSAADDTAALEPVLSATDVRDATLDGVDFTAAPGEILGFAGITGSGRDRVLGAVFGMTPRAAGTVEVRGRKIDGHSPAQAIANGMAYLPADRRLDGGVMALSARENLTLADLSRFWRRGRLAGRAERAETRSWFERLRVRPTGGTEHRLETFSGGNQQKILIAKWLRRKPTVLLLDEPTQGVDVGARAALHHLLVSAATEGMAVVISSSDSDELATVCHRVLIMRDGRVAQELLGAAVTASTISRQCLANEESARHER